MNVSLEYSKTLAGEGAILLLLSLVPYAGWILGIIGVVLLLRGMKELSNYYQDEKIYQDSLTGVKFYIIALIAAGVAIAALDSRHMRNSCNHRGHLVDTPRDEQETLNLFLQQTTRVRARFHCMT